MQVKAGIVLQKKKYCSQLYHPILCNDAAIKTTLKVKHTSIKE